ncbi:hypothetical protein MMC20_007423 [Loxospora ochrophaea]|nr:hypothetical protein [Loxospora ochrophaea]
MCNGVDWTNAWEEDMVGVLDASGVRLNRRRFLAEIQVQGLSLDDLLLHILFWSSLPLSGQLDRRGSSANFLVEWETRSPSSRATPSLVSLHEHVSQFIVTFGADRIISLAAGPYSQAIQTPHLIFVSGQIPATANGDIVSGTIADQTRACCENILAILKAAGSGLSKVVKVNVFLTDMANFTEMNSEYEKHFAHKPARSCVAVRQLPKGVPIEIECTALP